MNAKKKSDAQHRARYLEARNCRKITDATCAGYFFEVKLLKQLSKNVGAAGSGVDF